jgi:hypothetical protein
MLNKRRGHNHTSRNAHNRGNGGLHAMSPPLVGLVRVFLLLSLGPGRIAVGGWLFLLHIRALLGVADGQVGQYLLASSSFSGSCTHQLLIRIPPQS